MNILNGVIYCCDGVDGFHAADCEFATKGEPDTESEFRTISRRVQEQQTRWPNAGDPGGAEL